MKMSLLSALQMNPELKALLETISLNKSTAVSHPLDKKRWYQFVVTAHMADNPLDASSLFDALIGDGWQEEVARTLSSEYETFIELLKCYDDQRYTSENT